MNDLAPSTRPTDEPGRGFWIGLALGTPVMVYGTVELVQQAGFDRAFAAARWLAGGLLLHDLVLVPVVLAIVWLIGRWTPEWLRTPARAGVLASALVVAVGWPGLRGYGNRPDNPTVHPLQYGSAVLTVLAVVWVAVLTWALWRRASRATRLHARESHGDVRGSARTSQTPGAG